jgi:hypothetical protein
METGGVDRRIVQIAATTDGESPGWNTPVLFALASDGTVWRIDQPGDEDTAWVKLWALPLP